MNIVNRTEANLNQRPPNIWWIASYPKSGNTWVRLFLSAYANNGLPGINSPVGRADNLTYYNHIVSPRPVREMATWEEYIIRPTALLHRWNNIPAGKSMWVKSHNINGFFHDIPMVPALLCQGAIYITRDPRSLVPSLAEHTGTSTDQVIEDLNNPQFAIRNQHFTHLLNTWSAHVKSWTDCERLNIHVVRYEDMLREPLETFRGIISFAFGEVEEEKLERAVLDTEFDRLRAQEEKHGFKEKSGKAQRFFRRGSDDWVPELTSAQAQRIEEDHSEVMQATNYMSSESQVNGKPPTSPTAAR